MSVKSGMFGDSIGLFLAIQTTVCDGRHGFDAFSVLFFQGGIWPLMDNGRSRLAVSLKIMLVLEDDSQYRDALLHKKTL